MTNKIMVRQGKDDFEALLVACGMEDAGAEVISVAFNGQHTQQGAVQPCSKFTIWARIPEGISIDDVDKSINAMIDGT